MDDQQWNWFLTPSSTPTASSFDQASLHTPRPSTHFQDAFSPYIQQQYAAATPAVSAHDYSTTQPPPQESMHMSFHAHIPQPQIQQIYQHDLSGFDAARYQASQYHANQPLQQAFPGSLAESFQVQTPPPSKDSSSKRRSKRSQSVVFGTPSSLASRRLQATQLQENQVGTAQAPLTHLRQPIFISAPLQYADLGPSSAPADFDSSNVPWNPASSASFPANVNAWTVPDDPFSFHAMHAPALGPAMAPLPPRHQVPSQHFAASVSQSFPQPSLPAHSRSMSQLTLPSQSQPTPNMMCTASGVNPTLLYTSPGRFVPAAMHSSMVVSGHSMLRPADRMQQPVYDMQANSDFNPPGIPSLRRSNTTGSSRSSSSGGADQPLGRSNTNIPRKTSPLKRTVRSSLTSISETPKHRPRTSVVLTVDSNGRARTETRIVDGTSPIKSWKDRYPNLLDSSDEESDSDSSSQIPSKNASFTSLNGLERHSKMARLDPPIENLEGLSLPGSNSSASVRVTPSKQAHAATAQMRRQGSAKKPQHQSFHSRRNTLTSLNSSFESLISTETPRVAQHDAGAALRQVMEGRTSQHDLAMPPPNDSTQRQRPFTQAGNPCQGQAFPARASSLQRSSRSVNFVMDRNHMDSAPMGGFQSPTKARDYADTMSSITRCVCDTPFDDGKSMIQCNACNMWLHSACLGLTAHSVPQFYICHFCTPPSNNYGRQMWKAAV